MKVIQVKNRDKTAVSQLEKELDLEKFPGKSELHIKQIVKDSIKNFLKLKAQQSNQ